MRTGVFVSTLSVVLAIPLSISLASFEAQAKPGKSGEWKVSPRKAKIKNPIAADAASVAIGAKLFAQECENCHGKTGKGDGSEAADLDKPVRDFSTSDMWAQSDGAIRWKIRTGRRPMPSFKKMLSKDEIWHVTNYIRQTFDPAKKTP